MPEIPAASQPVSGLVTPATLSPLPLWALLLGVFIFLSFDYGGRGLNEPDEGRYSIIALQFLTPGADWWEPKMSDFGHYDKPPLVYWFTALCFKVLGRNEYAARVPCLVGALLTVIGVWWAARRLYNELTARWAALICGTFAQVWLLARFLTPDMLLTGFCTLGVAAWAESRHRGGHIGWWLLSLTLWTLGWWTKATPLLIPFFGLVLACWLLRDRTGLRALRPLRLLAGIVVLGSPWFLVMLARHPDLEQFFFHRELVERVTGHIDGRHGNAFYYLFLSLVAWLPWWPLLVLCWWRAGKAITRPSLNWLLGALGWDGIITVIGLIAFSALASKLPTYTVLLAPWAALLLARGLLAVRPLVSANFFQRTTIITLVLYGFLIVTGVLLYPRFEARIRWNSSMRPIARALRAQHAEVVYLDRYWPGIEFYFGEQVYYVLSREPRERADDNGVCPSLGRPHFVLPTQWKEHIASNAATNIWLVHYTQSGNAPFADARRDTNRREDIAVGDFELLRVK